MIFPEFDKRVIKRYSSWSYSRRYLNFIIIISCNYMSIWKANHFSYNKIWPLISEDSLIEAMYLYHTYCDICLYWYLRVFGSGDVTTCFNNDLQVCHDRVSNHDLQHARRTPLPLTLWRSFCDYIYKIQKGFQKVQVVGYIYGDCCNHYWNNLVWNAFSTTIEIIISIVVVISIMVARDDIWLFHA